MAALPLCGTAIGDSRTADGVRHGGFRWQANSNGCPVPQTGTGRYKIKISTLWLVFSSNLAISSTSFTSFAAKTPPFAGAQPPFAD